MGTHTLPRQPLLAPSALTCHCMPHALACPGHNVAAPMSAESGLALLHLLFPLLCGFGTHTHAHKDTPAQANRACLHIQTSDLVQPAAHCLPIPFGFLARILLLQINSHCRIKRWRRNSSGAQGIPTTLSSRRRLAASARWLSLAPA